MVYSGVFKRLLEVGYYDRLNADADRRIPLI